MFEGVVASLFNRYLGKYVEDLDLENLNVGIFGGNVILENLKLKPEALYELGLPIVVKVGTIGKLSLNIPWNRLCNQTSVITIEEVFILACPVTSDKHKPELEKRLLRAEKRRILDKLDPNTSFLTNGSSPENFAETLITSILNNLKIYIHNVHIRYEDTYTDINMPVSFGLCIHNFSVETTNSKWKPISHSSKMGSVYQVVKLESFSIYCNVNCTEILLNNENMTSSPNNNWVNCMKRSLETFSIFGETFDFIVKPISARIKIIINKSNEARIPKLLVDFVLQDAALQLSHQQYLALVQLSESFSRISVNRLYRKFRPDVSVSGNTKQWWIYAYECVVSERVKPYTWPHLFSHRKNYRSYCHIYRNILTDPSDAEIKVDLQRAEDMLDICSIIIAREHTKIQFRKDFPDKIVLKEQPVSWWVWNSENAELKKYKLCLNDKKNGFWHLLSQNEKNNLCEMIGYNENENYEDKPKQYIEHKFNFTIANFNFSLISGGSETLVIAMSHLLSSIETRPSAKAYKLSARVESLVVEGASVEYSLIPIITSESVVNGNHSGNFLIMDFEKNPLNSDVDYLLSISSESLEIVYHEFALSSFASFLQTPTLSMRSASAAIWNKFTNVLNSMATGTVTRRCIFQLNVDLKLPHFIVPEFGSLQKGGKIIIFDMGRLKIWSDLQLPDTSLEDATQLELEEKLYDRFYFSLTDFQILMFDGDQEWRNFKKIHTSQYHILSKIHSQIVFSNSIKPESKQLPRYKLNVSLQKLKINMSDSRIVSLINFINNLPTPKSHTVLHLSEHYSYDNIKLKDRIRVLEKIQHIIASSELRTQLLKLRSTKEEAKKSFLTVDKSGLSSEVSDEDSEIWARIMDLPGFDDNVSQNNVIVYLLRINIVQIIVELKRSSSNVDKPYIILHLVNFCCDTAFMEYGPAVQISLASISIVDKLHSSASSAHTQILNTEGKPDVISILYRKVRSDCPDFKSHFHSVEQSLVIEINTVQLVFHKESLVDLYRYLQYFSNKFKNRSITNTSVWIRNRIKQFYKLRLKTSDPPIPPGATKFSYSTRISDVKLQLCDTEIDFLLIRVAGFELDCMFKTNERLIFRAYLMTLSIDDISNTSLYPKILSVEEEKLMEIKYVRRSPRASKTNIDTTDDIKSDGVFKFHFSRIHVVLMFKLIYDLEKFFNPFIPAKVVKNLVNFLEIKVAQFFTSLRFCTDKIHVSINFQLPTFLLPQQASSPNLIIFNAGDFTVENFFKELICEEDNKTPPIIDNALIKLDSVAVSRAIVNFNGAIIVQETIMGPVCCKTDTKRLLLNSDNVHEFDYLPIFEINSSVDMISINLGQKDFSILNLIWLDSILKILAFCNLPKDKYSDSFSSEEVNVRKLEEFFYQVESNRKQVALHVNFEGLLVCLYSDIDEVLSSPVRDESRSLCKFRVGETAVNGIIFANGKTEYQLSVQSLLLEDTRVQSNACIKRIFQSYGATNKQSNNENVCITVPPVISITVNKNQLGESHCNVLIDHTRLNLGVSFLMELFRFFIEATPYEPDVTNNGGLVNYGYTPENCEMKNGFFNSERSRASSARDSASCLEECEGLSLSITCRKPEIMLFSQVDDYRKSHALLLRADVSVEYVRHPTNVSFICNISDLHMLSKLQSTLIKTSSNVVLQPCNIEISKNWAAINEETKISVICDKINLHISASTVHTVLNIMRELDSYFFAEPNLNKCDSSDNFYRECDDLWTAKKITPYCLPQKNDNSAEPLATCVISEIMILSVPSIKVMFEIEDVVQKKPVLLLKMRAEAKLRNWSNSLEMKGDVSLQCSYYNYKVNAWEPVLEPCAKTENIYRPWEISIKAFKSKSYPISIILGHNKNHEKSISRKKTSVSSAKESLKSATVDSETSAGEDECESIRSVKKSKLHTDKTNYNYSDTGSDSENEDTVMEKLKTRFGQLLIDESSDENIDTDSDTSLNEQSFNNNNNSDDNTDDDTLSHVTNNSFLLEKRAVFITKQRESADSGLDSVNYDKSATYIILETQERFEMVITPCTMSVVKQILDSFSLKFNNILTDTQILSLKNDIAPHSTIILRSKSLVGPMKILMCANYSLSESSPSSPGSTIGSPCNAESPTDLEFQSGIESFEGGFAPDAYSKTDNAKRKSDGDILLNALQFPRMSVDFLYTKVMDRQLYITVNGFEELTVICPTRTTNKYHLLQPVKNNTRYYIVISVENDLWGQSIIVRSPLQMKNETCFPLALYYKKNALDNTGFDQIGELTNPFEDSYKFAILEPDEVYNVPITITYHCAVHVLPIYEEYHLSEIGLWWKELANDITTPKDVICKPKNENSPVFAIRAITTEGVFFSNPCSRALPNYTIRLIPSVFVYNLLPCAFQIKIPSADFSIRIEAGGKSSIYSIDMNIKHAVHVEVPMYFGIAWTGSFHLCSKMEEKMLSMTTDQDTDGGNKHLTLSVRVDKAESYNVMVYSPYWIVNKTGLPIQLKGSSSDIVYETLVEEPLFFAFRKTQKKNIRLRIYQSSWSSAFSIDTAGCSGLITCRDRERNRNYYILVEISLSQLNPQLTKIITLLPYFLISNESHFPIRYMEENEQADLWIDLPQNQTIPFWPETNSMKMYIKYRDSSLVSQHFFINQACQTVLRMDKGSAIVVDIVGGDNKPFLIIFQDYKTGDAPVRIDNFCEDLFLKISQENSGQVTLLSPYQSLLYTWDDPTLERKLQWNVYNRKSKGFVANFKTDGYGQEYVSFKLIKQQTLTNNVKTNKLSSSLKKFTSKYTAESSSSCEESEREDNTDISQMIRTHKGKVVVYWVSYLEGTQRVLLFTQDEQVAFYAYSRIDSERSSVELFLSIKGIGLSLVNEQKSVTRELAYISVNDSAAIWEVNIAHSWKILPLELATWIEHQWSQGIKKAQLKDYVNVDLEKMQLIKPFFGELKRTYQPAFWLHCRKSFNYYYLQWKIHKFQVDNQLPNSVFQSVIYPKVVSYDVIRKYGLKPCIEGTFVKKKSTEYERDVYKYIKFMALEFSIQVDKQFVLSLYELLHPWSRSESSSLRIRADICKVHHPLTVKFHNNYKSRRKTVVEYLYFSPIKLQFSFTSQNVQHLQSNVCNQTYVKACLHFILNCISSSYVDFKGVKLKCPYFEESGIITHIPSKMREIRYHYFHNLVQQMYTHILGSESVLCNANHEMDLCEEYVDFYYDLSFAFLKKVDEFAEAISEAARCLLSHVTTSSINSTSSLIMCGKRISLDLGLNPEILKKKSITQQISFEEPEEVLRGDSCFEIGVIHGLSGVSMNLPTCNQQEGIELFFRTAGKHLLRLLNKYSPTIVNMPITAIDGIRRAAETGTDITFRRRLPKYINPFGMKPYSVHHAIGLNILNSFNKGIYAETDDYWTHVVLTNDGHSCLLITLQRIFFITKIRLWDDWKIEWCIDINDVIEVPQIIDNKLTFKIRQEDSVHNLYGDDKTIEHTDVNLLFWLQKMIEIVFIINLENKPCFFVESQVLKK